MSIEVTKIEIQEDNNEYEREQIGIVELANLASLEREKEEASIRLEQLERMMKDHKENGNDQTSTYAALEEESKRLKLGQIRISRDLKNEYDRLRCRKSYFGQKYGPTTNHIEPAASTENTDSSIRNETLLKIEADQMVLTDEKNIENCVNDVFIINAAEVADSAEETSTSIVVTKMPEISKLLELKRRRGRPRKRIPPRPHNASGPATNEANEASTSVTAEKTRKVVSRRQQLKLIRILNLTKGKTLSERRERDEASTSLTAEKTRKVVSRRQQLKLIRTLNLWKGRPLSELARLKAERWRRELDEVLTYSHIETFFAKEAKLLAEYKKRNKQNGSQKPAAKVLETNQLAECAKDLDSSIENKTLRHSKAVQKRRRSKRNVNRPRYDIFFSGAPNWKKPKKRRRSMILSEARQESIESCMNGVCSMNKAEFHDTAREPAPACDSVDRIPTIETHSPPQPLDAVSFSATDYLIEKDNDKDSLTGSLETDYKIFGNLLPSGTDERLNEINSLREHEKSPEKRAGEIYDYIREAKCDSDPLNQLKVEKRIELEASGDSIGNLSPRYDAKPLKTDLSPQKTIDNVCGSTISVIDLQCLSTIPSNTRIAYFGGSNPK